MPTRTKAMDPALSGMPARVAQAREDAGLGVREATAISGVNVSRIEAGKRVAGLSISSALALAKALRVNLGWLLTGDGPKKADGRFVVVELTPEMLESIRNAPAKGQAAEVVNSKR